MWKRYRKRPVVVRARPAVAGERIETLEGVMVAAAGDFIIEGVAGEQYPCKPDIFHATYDEVREPHHDEDYADALVNGAGATK